MSTTCPRVGYRSGSVWLFVIEECAKICGASEVRGRCNCYNRYRVIWQLACGGDGARWLVRRWCLAAAQFDQVVEREEDFADVARVGCEGGGDVGGVDR